MRTFTTGCQVVTWSNVRETSRVAEIWWHLALSSAVVSRVRRLAQPVRRTLRPLTRDVQRGAPVAEFDGLRRAAEDSVVLTTAARVFVGGWVQWRESYGGRQAVRLTLMWRALDRAERIRLVSITLFVAVVTHVATTGFRTPDPTTSARAIWTLILTGLGWAIAEAPGLAAAWTDWRRRWPR